MNYELQLSVVLAAVLQCYAWRDLCRAATVHCSGDFVTSEREVCGGASDYHYHAIPKYYLNYLGLLSILWYYAKAWGKCKCNQFCLDGIYFHGDNWCMFRFSTYKYAIWKWYKIICSITIFMEHPICRRKEVSKPVTTFVSRHNFSLHNTDFLFFSV